MVLIQSDLFRALWYLVSSALVLSRGPMTLRPKFCEASGFFIEFSIEASDFAILIIAIHAALYIFRPTTSLAEAGLYPYRYIAYACWAIFPLLMASLAFINTNSPYVSTGTFCFLITQPFWYRLALSWVPRYFILCVIMIIYLVIYLYVKLKFKSSIWSTDSSLLPSSRLESADPEDISMVAANNSMRSTTVKIIHDNISRTHQSGLRTISNDPVWESFSFGNAFTALSKPGSQFERNDILDPSFGPVSGGNEEIAAFAPKRQPSMPVVDVRQKLQEDRVFATPTLIDDGQQAVNDASVFQAQISMLNLSSAHDLKPSDFVEPHDALLADEYLLRRQRYIRRQLRFLFIYPLVYMFMWLPPFVGQCFNYNDYYSTNPIFGLNCIVIVILSLQCAVDCWLFSYRERPWRHIPGSKGTFWNSFAFWTHGFQVEAPGKPPLVPARGLGPGKTKGEMIAEARAARNRRQDEMIGWRDLKAEERKKRKMSFARRGGREEKHWWEEEGKRRNDSVWTGRDTTTAVYMISRESITAEERQGNVFVS